MAEFMMVGMGVYRMSKVFFPIFRNKIMKNPWNGKNIDYFCTPKNNLTNILIEMKRIFLSMAFVFVACHMFAQADRMTVVVTNEGQLVGKFVRETDSTYVANPLDWEEVILKTQGRVEVWTPEKGKGFVVRKSGVTGNINVRKGPSTKTAVVAKITEADSNKDYPENSFECIGKTKGWYKIKVKGKVGYVRQDLMDWAAYYAD